MVSDNCPKCHSPVVAAKGKAPASEHVARYWACTACSWFGVDRTPEHEIALQPRKTS
jgi:hypothetical protein